MGIVTQDTGGPSEIPRIVASDAQRWCVEIDGYPQRLASGTEPGLQALSWPFRLGKPQPLTLTAANTAPVA